VKGYTDKWHPMNTGGKKMENEDTELDYVVVLSNN